MAPNRIKRIGYSKFHYHQRLKIKYKLPIKKNWCLNIKLLIKTGNNCYYLYIYLFTGQREWKGQFVSNFNTLLFCLCLNRLGAQNRVAAPLISNLWSFRSLLWNVISRHHSLCKLAMLCCSVDHFPFFWSFHSEWKGIYCWF